MGPNTAQAQSKLKIKQMMQTYMLHNMDSDDQEYDASLDSPESRYKSFLENSSSPALTGPPLTALPRAQLQSFAGGGEKKSSTVAVDERLLSFLMGPVAPDEQERAAKDLQLNKQVKMS